MKKEENSHFIITRFVTISRTEKHTTQKGEFLKKNERKINIISEKKQKSKL